MGTVRQPSPGALIVAVTFADETVLNSALVRLTAQYGPLAMQSDVFDFTMTDYYAAEMGANLKKRFFCFERTVDLESLPDIKLFTNALELEYASEGPGNPSRTVNLDPGYVTLSKLVLATTKDYSHRVYIGKGICGEVTLRFLRGTFTPFDHTYPDYRLPLAIGFFNRVREWLKERKKE